MLLERVGCGGFMSDARGCARVDVDAVVEVGDVD